MKARIVQLVGVVNLLLFVGIFSGSLLLGDVGASLGYLVFVAALLVPAGIGILRQRRWGRILAMVVGVFFLLSALGMALSPGELGGKWKPVVMMLIFAALQILAWMWLEVGPGKSASPAVAVTAGGGHPDSLRCPLCGATAAGEAGEKFCHLCGAPLEPRG